MYYVISIDAYGNTNRSESENLGKAFDLFKSLIESEFFETVQYGKKGEYCLGRWKNG